MTDPLAAPLTHVMPELIADKSSGDTLATAVLNQIRDYFQLFFAEVPSRRVMDEWGRWGWG